MIKDGRQYADDNKLMEASLIYDDVRNMYSKLEKDMKMAVHEEVSELYMDITLAKIRKLIHKIELYVEDSNTAKAKDAYDDIRSIYKNLPRRYKGSVSEVCHEAHRKIRLATK